jgi:hypothetical protein
MLARTTTALAVLKLAAPAAAFAHPGGVPHVHPHAAPLALALVLGLVVAATLVFRKRRGSERD